MRFTFSNLPATGWTLPASRIVDLARLCEEVGFDRFAVADLPYHYDCMTVMAACLLGTKRIAAESLVTNPYTRDPALVAATFATLADLSGGRAILGIGGGVESATRVYVAPHGHDRPHPATAVREAVSVYRAMWRGEKVTLDGQIVHVHDATLDCPLPPRIPILVAARADRMLRLAGEIADIAHLASLFLDPAHQRRNIAAVIAGAQAAGRDAAALEIEISVTLSVSEDREYARHEARRNAAQTILWMSGTDTHNLRRRDWVPPAELGVPASVVDALSTRWDMWREPELPAELEPLIDDATLDRFAVAGTASECAARLGEIAAGFPEVTGVRIKLPRPTRSATLADYERAIRGIGDVIARVAPASARDAAFVAAS
jgi:5,10-methylenetetrahydromethanopterin reductase